MICGSKKTGDKYESKVTLASRIVKVERQVGLSLFRCVYLKLIILLFNRVVDFSRTYHR